MHLGHEGDAATLQALDGVELPEWPAAVERDAGDVADELGQLAQRAGRRHGDPLEVVSQLEVRVLDPERVSEPERHLAQPAAEGRQLVQPALDQLDDALERVAPRHR